MTNNIELMSLFWTTAGVYPGQGEISRFDFKDRVEAAARAGFKGLGIWHTDLEHILQFRTLKEMRKILDDNGIKYLYTKLIFALICFKIRIDLYYENKNCLYFYKLRKTT